VIRNASQDWKAHELYSFDFFRDIYLRVIGDFHVDSTMAMCDFFQYQSNFNNLQEVFNRTAEEALRSDKPWYIGWANCRDRYIKSVLRELYQRPYFLPGNASDSHTDWMFMGSPGPGAEMHHDQIMEPSWQAQIRGQKRWKIEPPPECAAVCRKFAVVVNPGDIIVIDTFRWFHQTEVLGDELSITIGSEYSNGTLAETWDQDEEEAAGPDGDGQENGSGGDGP